MQLTLRIATDTRTAEAGVAGLVNVANAAAQEIGRNFRAALSGQAVPPPDLSAFRAAIADAQSRAAALQGNLNAAASGTATFASVTQAADAALEGEAQAAQSAATAVGGPLATSTAAAAKGTSGLAGQTTAATEALKKQQSAALQTGAAGAVSAAGSNQAAQAMLVLGQVSQDATMFQVSLNMGFRAIANNIPQLVQNFGALAVANGGVLGGFRALFASLGTLTGLAGFAGLAFSVLQMTGLLGRLEGAFDKASDAAEDAYERAKKLFDEVARFEGKDFATEFYVQNKQQAQQVLSNLQTRIAQQRRDLRTAEADLAKKLSGVDDQEDEASPASGVRLGSRESRLEAARRRVDDLRQSVQFTDSDIRNMQARLRSLDDQLQQQARILSAGGTSPEEMERQRQREREAERARLRAERDAEALARRQARFAVQQSRIETDAAGKAELERARAVNQRNEGEIAGIQDKAERERRSIEETARYGREVAQIARDAELRNIAKETLSAGAAAQKRAEVQAQYDADIAEANATRAEKLTELQERLDRERTQQREEQEREAEQRRNERVRAAAALQEAYDEADLDTLRTRLAIEAQGIADEGARRRAEILNAEAVARAEADQTFAREQARIVASGGREEEIQAALYLQKVRYQNALDAAGRKREEALAEYSREQTERAVKDAETRAEKFADKLADATTRAAGAALRALNSERRYSNAEVDLEKIRFGEREKNLKQSLRRREVTEREYALEMQKLAEDRARFEKDVDTDRASVGARVYKAFYTTLTEEAGKWAASELRHLLRVALAHAASEKAKTVATAAGTGARTTLNLGEIGSALLNAGADMVGAAAKGIKSVAALPFPTNLLAGGAVVATLQALYSGVKNLMGFAGGGYTGDGDRNEIAGPVHRGEFVFTKAQVGGDPGPFYALASALNRGWTMERVLALGGLQGYANGGYVSPSSFAASETKVVLGGYDDTRLVATGQATNARLDRLSRAVDALANRPITYVVGDADARRQIYAARREARRVEPNRTL